MSLINQVLKDLERRQAPERPAPTPPLQTSRRRRTPLAAWWVIAAVGIGAALHWILATDTPPHPQQPEVVQATFEFQEPAPPDDAAPEPNPAPPAEETDRAADKETRTETDHAAVAPVRDPDPSSVEQVAGEPSATPDPTSATSVPPAARERNAAEETSAKRAITIERADDGREHSDIDTARRAIARGHHQQAERQLRQLLEQHPDHDQARELLAVDLMRRGRASAAIDVLEQGLGSGREPTRFAHRLGRILLEQGQVERARTMLMEHAPPPAHDPDFQQLLAAAHRQAGDHLAAEAAYRRLTETVPYRAAAWIGLGVSLEALDRPAEAHQAYSRVTETGDPQAVRFARQRLRAIQDPDGDRS